MRARLKAQVNRGQPDHNERLAAWQQAAQAVAVRLLIVADDVDELTANLAQTIPDDGNQAMAATVSNRYWRDKTAGTWQHDPATETEIVRKLKLIPVDGWDDERAGLAGAALDIAHEVQQDHERLLVMLTGAVLGAALEHDDGAVYQATGECLRLAQQIVDDHAELSLLDSDAAQQLNDIADRARELLLPVPRVQRLRRAWQQAGSQIARGVHADIVEQQLAAWDPVNNRPPLGRREITRVVDTIVDREIRKRS